MYHYTYRNIHSVFRLYILQWFNIPPIVDLGVVRPSTEIDELPYIQTAKLFAVCMIVVECTLISNSETLKMSQLTNTFY